MLQIYSIVKFIFFLFSLSFAFIKMLDLYLMLKETSYFFNENIKRNILLLKSSKFFLFLQKEKEIELLVYNEVKRTKNEKYFLYMALFLFLLSAFLSYSPFLNFSKEANLIMIDFSMIFIGVSEFSFLRRKSAFMKTRKMYTFVQAAKNGWKLITFTAVTAGYGTVNAIYLSAYGINPTKVLMKRAMGDHTNWECVQAFIYPQSYVETQHVLEHLQKLKAKEREQLLDLCTPFERDQIESEIKKNGATGTHVDRILAPVVARKLAAEAAVQISPIIDQKKK